MVLRREEGVGREEEGKKERSTGWVDDKESDFAHTHWVN
jgi:hypothetical protein